MNEQAKSVHPSFKHGFRAQHGRVKANQIYTAWKNMRARCSNPKLKKYPRYGGRGITVCERWLNSFENFLADMGPRPDGTSIERKDVNGNYEPTNCVWATTITQANNTRRNVILEFEGRKMTVAQWARDVGINGKTLLARIRRQGWSVLKALTTPAEQQNKQSHIPRPALLPQRLI